MTQNRTGKIPERQINVSSTGLSALPWVVGAVLLLGVAAIAGLYWERTVTVQSVSFANNYFVSEGELRQKVDIPAGIKQDSLNYANIIDSIKEILYVKDAEVKVEPSGDLIIQITEHRPMAMLAEGNHKAYVNAGGLMLPLVPGRAVDVPILYGLEVHPQSDTIQSEPFNTVRNFLDLVRQNPVSDATISEIAWTETEGIVALTNDSGVKLVFGRGDFETRLRNWEAFYAEIIRQKGMSRMQSVDLRFRDQIVTREH